MRAVVLHRDDRLDPLTAGLPTLLDELRALQRRWRRATHEVVRDPPPGELPAGEVAWWRLVADCYRRRGLDEAGPLAFPPPAT